MTMITVGGPIDGTPAAHQEGYRYNFRSGHHQLDIFFDNPTPEETSQFQTGPVQWGLWHDQPVMWSLIRIGDLPWADAPYTPLLVEPQARDRPRRGGPSHRYHLLMTLCDTTQGSVTAIRSITMSPGISRKLADIVDHLLTNPGTLTEYEARLAQAYREYPESRLMLPLAQPIQRFGQNP